MILEVPALAIVQIIENMVEVQSKIIDYTGFKYGFKLKIYIIDKEICD